MTKLKTDAAVPVMRQWIQWGVGLTAVLLAVTAGPLRALGQDPAPASTPAAAAAQPNGLRIFSCGHSFHTFIWISLWDLAVADGFKAPERWWPQFIGGSSTLQHWNLPDDKNTAKRLLTEGTLDVLTMAPIQFPDAGIENFVKLGLAHNPNMRFTVQLSWSFVDLQAPGWTNALAAPDHNKETPEQLQALAAANIKAGEDQIEKLNKQLGKTVVFLVPTAQAVIALRTKIYNKEFPGLETQAELFQDKIGHPSAPLQALNAYLHYAVIYHRNPVGLPKVAALKNSPNPAWDDKFNRSLQELAWETVTHYPFSGVTAPEAVKPN